MKWAAACVMMCVAGAAMADDLVSPGAKLYKVATGYGLADGPAYDGKGNLYFPDVKGGNLHRYNEGEDKVHMFKENIGRISATFFSNDGKLTAADNGNARIIQFDGDQVKVLAAEPTEKPARSPNDLVVDKSGGVYYTLTRQACVQYAKDGKITTAAADVKGANGIILSPDEKTLYVAGHSERQIWAFPVLGPGKLGERKLLATLGPGPGAGADGMTIDSKGNIYCAGQGGIWVTSPTGEHLTTIAVEEKPLVNCTFGGSDMKTLYIVAGTSLYKIQMSVAGVKQVGR
jgi:gluconolactonase